MTSNRKHMWILGALLVLGAAVRVYFAACFQYSMNSDYGIVALMAKHMAEGRDFPVFFYGQAYMGSLEPMLSALFCKLFGLSTFQVCLGTAFLGILLLPVVYAWGRDAGGRAAGVAALIFVLIGPVGYFHYLASPRGGYALTLLLGTLILWLSGRLAAREFRNAAVPAGWYALLGLMAGVGWWTNQLIVVSLLTAAIVLLVALRPRIISWRIPAGLAGFLAGSLPWWIWNFQYSWESLGMMGSLGQTPAGVGLKLFFASRFPDLMDLMDVPVSVRIAGLAGIAALVLIAAWSLVVQWRRRGAPPDPEDPEGLTKPAGLALAPVSLIMAFLFIMLSALLFCRAHFAVFNTARYLLPIVPALAVLVGVATAFLVSRTRYGLGWAPLLLILVFQVWSARFTLEVRHNRTWEVLAQKLNPALADAKVEAVFCEYIYHWLNAATGEAQCFVDIVEERYLPYERRGEMARHVAFFDNVGNVAAFITNSGGSVRCGEIMTFPVYYDLQPPAQWGLVPTPSWATAVDSQGSNVLTAISDGRLPTRWQASVLTNKAPWLEIRFKAPVIVQGVRFLSDNGYYPPAWAVDGKTVGDQDWRELTPTMPIGGYFWSGPRPYCNGLGFRPECRFQPESVSCLRVRFLAPEREEVYVSELTVFGGAPAPDTMAESEALCSLLAMLENRGIKRLYSERWIANEVAAATGSNIVTLREPAVFDRRPGESVRGRTLVLSPIRLDPHAALLVRTEEAPICRQSLDRQRVVMRETSVGPWILFDLAPGQWQLRYAADTGLCWSGFNVLAGKRDAKRYVLELMDLAEQAQIPCAAGLALLQEALNEMPDYAPLLQRLVGAYRECGEGQKAADLERRVEELIRPVTSARASFGRGIELLGVTLNPASARPGDIVAIRYYWYYPPEAFPRPATQRPIVFVHFLKDPRRFQDDHILLVDLKPEDIACQSPGEVLLEERSITVPPDAEPGMYEIRMGLIDAGTEKRWPVRTDLAVRHRAVILPVELRVQ